MKQAGDALMETPAGDLVVYHDRAVPELAEVAQFEEWARARLNPPPADADGCDP